MLINIIGGGPAGLFFALLVKRRAPWHEIRIFEQNAADATYGFGVVFQDKALRYVAEAHPQAFALLSQAMETWDELAMYQNGERVMIDGNGFSAIARLELLRILQTLCRDAGIALHFGCRIDDVDALAEADLLVGADGVGSLVRERFAEWFRPRVDYLSNRFAWYGTEQVFPTLSLTFRAQDGGAFVAHHYRYSPSRSTFIVECDAATFERMGFANMDEQTSARVCADIFAEDLGGHGLLTNRSIWRRFPVITNEAWTCRNAVLLGDALRTVHFSIGSGTRLALEDAIALDKALQAEEDDVGRGLERFVAERRPVVETMLSAAAASYAWYEHFAERMPLDAWALAYSYMTRSGRVDDDKLREIAPAFMAGYAAHHRYDKQSP